MAGGGGTRLWPLSTEARPKQFLSCSPTGACFGETYERVRPAAGDVFVATAGALRGARAPRAPGSLRADRILAEPARRNSGPALLCAALALRGGRRPRHRGRPVGPDGRRRRGIPPRARAAAAALADARVRRRPRRSAHASGDRLRVSRARRAGAGDGTEVVRLRREARAGGGARSSFAPATSGTPASSSSGPSRLLAEARRVAADLMAPWKRIGRSERRVTAGGGRRVRSPAGHLDRLRRDGEGGRRARRAAARGLERRRDLAVGPRDAEGVRRQRQPRPLRRCRCSLPACATRRSSSADDGVLVLPFDARSGSSKGRSSA